MYTCTWELPPHRFQLTFKMWCHLRDDLLWIFLISDCPCPWQQHQQQTLRSVWSDWAIIESSCLQILPHRYQKYLTTFYATYYHFISKNCYCYSLDNFFPSSSGHTGCAQQNGSSKRKCQTDFQTIGAIFILRLALSRMKIGTTFRSWFAGGGGWGGGKRVKRGKRG